MIRNFFKTLFSRTATRGRLEYLGAMVALVAGATLFVSLGFAASSPFIAYPAFLAAMVLHTGLWFVVAQRVRDIGWSVPLMLVAIFAAGSLSSFAAATEGGAVLVVGGPWAMVYTTLLLLLAIVPGSSRPATVTPA